MFIESPRFPDCISEGSTGGPMWSTQIAISVSGYEKRSSRWANALHVYNAAFGVRSLNDMEKLKAFFLACRGSAYGFRYKDWADYSSSIIGSQPSNFDQELFIGDGSTTVFPLIKQYTSGLEYVREITKPVDGTILIAKEGAALTEGVDFTVDYTTGLVTMTTPPATDHVVTGGFYFDVPCRFGSDELSTNLIAYQQGSANVPVKEIRQ